MKEHITIGGKAFVVPIRYMEGHVCTESEAEQLNKDIVSKARNNLATKSGLTQGELDNWVGSYQFGARQGRTDPVIAEAKLIAKRLIKGKITAKAIDKMLAKNTEKIMERARRRVRDITELSEAALSDG